jgi:3-oxoadipate enol-lactonase
MDSTPGWLTLVHGGLVDSATWSRQAAALAPVARVLTYDLRGYGDGATTATATTVPDHARDLIALWDASGVDRGVVVGFSVGGLIAQEVALRAPERVAGLVLVSTAGRVGDAARRLYIERAAEIDAHGLEPSLDALLDRAFSGGFRERQPELTARYRQQVATMPPQTIAGTLRAVARHDRLADLGAIRCPTLVVAGDQDPAMGVAAASELHNRLPDATLVVLRGAGHTIHVERPSTFAHLVADFLAFDGRPPDPGH